MDAFAEVDSPFKDDEMQEFLKSLGYECYFEKFKGKLFLI